LQARQLGLLRFCARKPAMYLDDRWGGRRPLNVARSHPYTIHADGKRMVQMAPNVQELRPKATETEKITINLGYVDLGHVDLMVQDGFYSNRTDFIRTAIRNQSNATQMW
jgi:hypothetical protein